MIFLKLAGRNIFRNRTRTALIVSAVGFSVFISIIVLAISDGSHEAMIRTSLRSFTGYGQIQRAPEKKITLSDIIDWDRFRTRLKQEFELSDGSWQIPFSTRAVSVITNLGSAPDFNEQREIISSLNTWMFAMPEQVDTRRAILEEKLTRDILIPLSERTFTKNPVVENTFPFDERVKKAVKTIPEITGYAPRLQSYGMVATEKNSSGGLILGIEPEQEKTVTSLHEKVAEGTFLETDDSRTCVIGFKLARVLSVATGEKIVIITRAIDGSTGALKLTVKGILRTGTDLIDKQLVLIPIGDCENMLRAYNQVHYIACACESAEVSHFIEASLKPILHDKKLIYLGWEKLIPDLLEFLALDSFFGYLFLGIVLTVVVFGILTGIITSVLERTGEFGVMLALGTKPIQIVTLILSESIVVTATGVSIGLLTGIPLALWLVDNPIPLPVSSEEVTATYGLANELPFYIYPEKIAVVIAFLFGMSIVLSLIPAVRASFLKPCTAIRESRK